MRLPLLPMLIWMILNIGIDVYIYRVLSIRLKSHPFWKKFHLLLTIVLLIDAIIAISLPLKSGDDATLIAVNWLLFTYITVYIPKYIFFILDLISRIPAIFHFRRWKWLGRFGAALSIFLFFSFWWGTLINRYQLEVKEVTVAIPHLPKSFEGYKIVQFSDFHVGSYNEDTSFVEKVVGVINNLHPNAIFFTGDIVNRHSTELEPFVPTLKELYAPDGVLAILGNHDYGDYHYWRSPEEKRENMALLYNMFEQAGWKLLRNETYWLVRGNDSIAVIGVENIGDPPFPVYGSLTKAYSNCEDEKVKILLSHNPAHWEDSIANHSEINIPLTLSGHTHAMQIEIAGLSPAALRYKKWGGLYVDEEGIHQLYVNIGLGTVGLPMRLGATPEITLITLTGLSEEK